MSIIQIRNFGGELPRVSPRALPAEAAQVSSNLLATASEFRPMMADSVVTTAVAGAKTLHRLTRDATGNLRTDDATGWIAEVADKNYVKGQINDDATERTYVSFNDGTARPRAVDALGQDRVLGVPKPGNLTVALVAADEFTPEDREQAKIDARALVTDVLRAQATRVTIGGINGAPAGTSTVGYLDATAWAGPKQVRLYRLSSTAGAFDGSISQTYSSAPSSSFGWVFDPIVGSAFATTDATNPAWEGGPGIDHVYIPFRAFADTYQYNAVSLRAALAAIALPGGEAGEKLFDTAQLDNLVARMTYWFSTTATQISPLILTFQNTLSQLKILLDLGSSNGTGQREAFYARPDVVAAINGAFGNFAGQVFSSANYYVTLGGGTPYTEAQIKTDALSFYALNDIGVKALDKAGLATLIRTKFAALAAAGATAETKRSIELWSPDALIAQLDTYVGERAYIGDFGFGSITSDFGVASEVAKKKAELESLGERIEAFYAWVKDEGSQQLPSNVDEFFAARTVDANLPDGVIRMVDSRFYLATFVNDWDEESAPSPVSAMLEVDQNDSVTVTVPVAPAGRNLVGWRLYRSNVGSEQTSFQLIQDAAAPNAVNDAGGAFKYFSTANRVYADTTLGAALGEVCPTISWSEPPFRIDVAASSENTLVPKGSDPYLRGLVGMPNGVMAGYVDNFVAFCDPYHPYAWPVEYQIPLEYPIVGLGVFGQSLFVGTYANPYILSGADAASMSAQKLDDAQSCLSARSIVSAEGGVLYASPDGICFASLNGVQVVTTALFAREDWQKLNPESIIAAMHEGVYYFWYSGNGGGCYALDTVAKKLTRVDMTAGAVFADSLTDALFYTSGTQVKRAFAAGRRTGVWKSSKMVMPAHAAFAWLQVEGDQDALNQATVKWYGDGELRYTATLTDIRPVRLPAGRWLEHEIEITSTARLTKVTLAGHTLELQQA